MMLAGLGRRLVGSFACQAKSVSPLLVNASLLGTGASRAFARPLVAPLRAAHRIWTATPLAKTGKHVTSVTSRASIRTAAAFGGTKAGIFGVGTAASAGVGLRVPSLRLPALLRRAMSESTAKQGGFVAWYNATLQANPLRTTALSTCFIISCGDILCQFGIEGGPYDPIRTARMGIIGLFMVGPTLHFWYRFLYARFPGTATKAVFTRLALDQFVFAPTFCAAFFAALFTLSGHPESYPDHMKNNYVDALIVNWGLWIPAQFINFRFIPAVHAVLFSNCIALVWNSYLSWNAHKDGAAPPEEGTTDGSA